MLAPGTLAPDFRLPDCDGKEHSLVDIQGERGTLIAFWCNHCPYVQHVRERFAALAPGFQAKGIGIALINANDLEHYPQDGPDQMREEAHALGYTFPYLLDPSQAIAKAYQAACTPDFFLFDRNLKLFYAGRFDDSRPRTGDEATGNELGAAAEALVNGQPPPANPRPSLGCNIKWKPGNEPG